MSLSVDEIKSLIVFGREQCLQSLQVEGLTVFYGAPLMTSTGLQTEEIAEHDESDLRRYSILGRKGMSK